MIEPSPRLAGYLTRTFYGEQIQTRRLLMLALITALLILGAGLAWTIRLMS